MCTRKQSLLAKVIARLSNGAVPVDGGIWYESPARHTAQAPVSERGRIPSLGSLPLNRQRCTP